MEFTKDQNGLVLDDGTSLVAVKVDREHTCNTCQIAYRFSGHYDDVTRCGSRFKCHPDDRNDKRNIIWRLKEKDPMETKEEMFNRILQRMEIRRYVGTVNEGTKEGAPHGKKLHDRTFTDRSLSYHYPNVGDDCRVIHEGRTDHHLIRDAANVGRNCLIDKGINVSWGCTFGNGCLFVGDSEINASSFGDGCLFGPGCTFRGKSIFGKDCVFLCDDPTAKPNPTVLKEFKMSGVDGSGREITVTIWSDWVIKVKAGCFNGTLDEFCKKARKENKMFYVHVVEDAADAAFRLLKEAK